MSGEMRSTGGNLLIEADATRADLMRSINDQLGDLHEWASESGRVLDLGEVTVDTMRLSNGRISVSVTADLAPAPHTLRAAIAPTREFKPSRNEEKS